RVILAGLHTAAEVGLKTRRRARGGGNGDTNIQEGQELFHLGCALLASGTKTALITRWPTGGQTHRDLVREFVRELPNMPADAAWQRSVLLARRTELDPEQEPRYKRPNEVTDIPTAEHPILWAGYLLFDTGYDATLEPVAPNPGNEPGAMPPPGAP